MFISPCSQKEDRNKESTITHSSSGTNRISCLVELGHCRTSGYRRPPAPCPSSSSGESDRRSPAERSLPLLQNFWETEKPGHSFPWNFCPQITEAPGSKASWMGRLGSYTEPKNLSTGVLGLGLPQRRRGGRCWRLLTQGVPHGDDRTLMQLRVPTLIRQNHSQVRPPVSPLLVPTTLKSSGKKWRFSQ